jgi:hypothetical protein
MLRFLKRAGFEVMRRKSCAQFRIVAHHYSTSASSLSTPSLRVCVNLDFASTPTRLRLQDFVEIFNGW